ncbi:MAG: hypothetical protein Q8O33_13130 [Pseudomonadota bacterium]|nr:hypothetical protein [Pseudomonadota bacterium]
MTQHELAQAKDPDLRASLAAIHRAADLARKTALQTDTGIVIVRDEKLVRISAEQLRHESQHE